MIVTPLKEALAVVDDQCLHYLVEFHATEASSAAEAMNGSDDGINLVGMIEAINGITPKGQYPTVNGEVNVNTGQMHHTFKIGRECSRVLYIQFIRTAGYPHVDKGGWNMLRNNLEMIGHRFGCDELDLVVDDPTEFTFRFWWD